MFNSQKINTDPFPYVSSSGSRHANPGWMGSEYFSNRQERKEYDNNPNPILVEFRMALDLGVSRDSIQAMFSQLDLHLNEWRRMGANEAQIDHARKVLERLVNVYSD